MKAFFLDWVPPPPTSSSFLRPLPAPPPPCLLRARALRVARFSNKSKTKTQDFELNSNFRHTKDNFFSISMPPCHICNLLMLKNYLLFF